MQLYLRLQLYCIWYTHVPSFILRKRRQEKKKCKLSKMDMDEDKDDEDDPLFFDVFYKSRSR